MISNSGNNQGFLNQLFQGANSALQNPYVKAISAGFASDDTKRLVGQIEEQRKQKLEKEKKESALNDYLNTTEGLSEEQKNMARLYPSLFFNSRINRENALNQLDIQKELNEQKFQLNTQQSDADRQFQREMAQKGFNNQRDLFNLKNQIDLYKQQQAKAIENNKIQAIEEKEKEAQIATVNNINRAIDGALNSINKTNTGKLGARNPFAGGDLDGHLETIKSNLSFDKLLDIKKRGGSLGALSDAELKLLGSTIASLSRSNTDGTLKDNLGYIKNTLNGAQSNKVDLSQYSDDELEEIANMGNNN